MRVFISCSFDSSTRLVIDLAKSIFKMYSIAVFVSGEVETEPLHESIKKHIRGSDAFFAILTRKKSSWVQNEIGIAYDAGIPIYAISEEGIKIEGILPLITVYANFNPKDPMSIITAISKVAEKIDQSRTEGEIGEIYKMFKSKRERIIYKIGTHAAAHTLFLLLILKDVNPAFFEIYEAFHKREVETLVKELELLQ